MPSSDLAKRDKHITRQIHKLFWEANLVEKKLFILSYFTRIPSIAITNVFIPLVVAYGVQAIIDKRFNDVNNYAFWILGLTVLASLFSIVGELAVSKNAAIGSKYIQNRVFVNFLAKDYDFYTNTYFGSLGAQAARIRDAFNIYGELVTLGIPRQITIFVAGVSVVGYHSLPLAIITIFAIFFVLSYTILTSAWRLKFRRIAAKASSKVAGYIGDSLSHGTAVKSFAMEDHEMKRLQKPLEKWAKAQHKVWVTFTPSVVGRMLLASIATAVLLVYSANLYQDGAISITIVILIQLYVIRLIASTQEISEMIKRYEEAVGNAYEPVKTMDIPVDIQDPNKPKTLPKKRTRTLNITDITYSYLEANKSQYAVKGFSLHIKPGEKVGLVGYSGAGKTTLTKLLLRFMDVNEGKIDVDGINIKDITQKDLRQVISYVPQEPLLFHRSIYENIAYANPNASKEMVIKAAKMAYVDEFVSELPKGYETLVGERGIKLSGGQRQRVAIARALLKDSPILVLDEATSALDSKSEKYIQDGLKELMKSRTSLVIAHRLSTIQRMDRIVVMDRGRVVQNGSHGELLEDKNGIYATLWAHQSGGYIGTSSGSNI
jgi:ATP-binding cassette subfamily B protein